MKKYALYIHWPFCLHKCPYCDFNSYVMSRPPQEDVFLKAYIKELEWSLERFSSPEMLTSIFIGGGTPSLMSSWLIDELLNAISRRCSLSRDIEITMEANPTSVETQRLPFYKAAGITRLSLGMQSLRNSDLVYLGRQHTSQEAQEALEAAKVIFGSHVSADFIYALPHQSIDQWRLELEEILHLNMNHLSLYQLTIEKGTLFEKQFQKGRLIPLCDNDASIFYELTHDMCAQKGLASYEVSNYARPGFECQHNLSYWRYDPYLGLGPGAHGRPCLADRSSVYETVTHKNPMRWVGDVLKHGHGYETIERLDVSAAKEEKILMGLRLQEGIAWCDLDAIPALQEKVETLQAEGYVSYDKERLWLTPRGRLVLDAVCVFIMND